MSTRENKAIVQRVIEEVYNKQNLSVVEELVSPAYIAHGPLGDLKGVDMYKQVVTQVFTAFPDHHIKTEDIIAEGDKVVMRWTVTGTHTGGDYMGIAPTGRAFTMTDIVITRIDGGKIVEEWESVDLFSQLQQLGAIPPVGGGG
jgi:predicted ester cyclase